MGWYKKQIETTATFSSQAQTSVRGCVSTRANCCVSLAPLMLQDRLSHSSSHGKRKGKSKKNLMLSHISPRQSRLELEQQQKKTPLLKNPSTLPDLSCRGFIILQLMKPQHVTLVTVTQIQSLEYTQRSDCMKS